MRILNLVSLQILLAAGFTAAAAERELTRDDLVREFSRLLPPGTVTGTQVVEMQGFRVEASHARQLGKELKPNGVEFDAITIEAPALFKTVVTKGSALAVGGGMAMFHRESGTPLLDAGDNDGDGRLDTVSYSVVDQAGQVALQVTDHDADGQPDSRIHFAQKYFEIWHGERWHRVENRDGKRGITLDGRFVELRQDRNRWIVPGTGDER